MLKIRYGYFILWYNILWTQDLLSVILQRQRCILFLKTCASSTFTFRRTILMYRAQNAIIGIPWYLLSHTILWIVSIPHYQTSIGEMIWLMRKLTVLDSLGRHTTLIDSIGISWHSIRQPLRKKSKLILSNPKLDVLTQHNIDVSFK